MDTPPEVYIFGPGRATNVPHRIVRHSPTGLAWGYGGSGPADTALNILALHLPRKTAERYYQTFKFDVVASIPWNDTSRQELPAEQVEDWIEENVPASER